MIDIDRLSAADRRLHEDYRDYRRRHSSEELERMAEKAEDSALKAELEEAAHWQFKREEAVEFDYDYD